jgi:hypothetical protein
MQRPLGFDSRLTPHVSRPLGHQAPHSAFRNPHSAMRAGGTVDRLDRGVTGGHGAGRLHTQPRRFVFSASGRDGRASNGRMSKDTKDATSPSPRLRSQFVTLNQARK